MVSGQTVNSSRVKTDQVLFCVFTLFRSCWEVSILVRPLLLPVQKTVWSNGLLLFLDLCRSRYQIVCSRSGSRDVTKESQIHENPEESKGTMKVLIEGVMFILGQYGDDI